jgi:hypothetical protein
MFYGQCWKCGERWELGTASTCQCPEELPAYTFKQSSEPVFAFTEMKPNYNMTFNRDGKQIGVLDFNGPEMTFTGDADESAKVFFDFIAGSFKARLEQERADEREACVKVAEDSDHVVLGRGYYDQLGDADATVRNIVAAIRARSNT